MTLASGEAGAREETGIEPAGDEIGMLENLRCSGIEV